MSIEAEALAGFESDRAHFHLRWAVAATSLLLLAGGLIAPRYHLLALTGERVTATAAATRLHHVLEPTVKRHGVVYRQGYTGRSFELSTNATLPDGRVLNLVHECSEELYDCVRAGGCREIPYVVSPLAPSPYQMGTRADFGWAGSLLLALVSLGACALYRHGGNQAVQLGGG